MGSHSNNDILIKIIKGEVAAPDALNSAQLFAREIGLIDGDVEIPVSFIYYKYHVWCEATGNTFLPLNAFSKSFKFKRRQTRLYCYYSVVDVFNYKENEKENKETVVKWQANQERKVRALKKWKKSLKKTITERSKEKKKALNKLKRNEKLRKKRLLLKEKEAQRKSEELQEESLIHLLDLKNGTSQE